MFSLVINPLAGADLKELLSSKKADDKEAAAIVLAFLEQLKEDQYLMDSLTIHEFVDDNIDVEHFASLWRIGYNMWRLKLATLKELNLQYRIIYAFEPLINRYHILGIVHRNFKYDKDDPRTKNIIAAYDELNLKRY